MFEDIRNKMRGRIRSFDYVMTLHAEEEMENDDLSIFDIENAILTGEIVERQKDGETDEWKYIFASQPIDDETINCCGKIKCDGQSRDYHGFS